MNQYNLLQFEKSPYLLQHRLNPVNWVPWGDAAFNKARQEDKPIFLSIGYSTCYWCHVMEKDSFEQDDVASLLNQHFICIKVDREERPDVDAIYMDAVVAMTGHGGWPMSVFLTPALKPFFGGTFFPRSQFVSILSRISELWHHERDKIVDSANELVKALTTAAATPSDELPPPQILKDCLNHYSNRFDRMFGGFGESPKFPPHQSILALMRIFKQTNSAVALEMVNLTLDRMARGGICDQLGGGFARYSVDRMWLVPHFEKMLYDNAQLAIAYIEAFQLTKLPHYQTIAQSILNYIIAEMTDPLGGFFSAQDAGEVGKEGEYYVWERSELQQLLDEEELRFAEKVWELPQTGNFEGGKIVLSLRAETSWSVLQDPQFLGIRTRLLEARRQREHPSTDDKVLTSWNGLMIAAFAKAFTVFGEAKYLLAAQAAADFITTRLIQAERLLHRYRDGEASISGMLEDYSYLIFGLLALGEAELNQERVRVAAALQNEQDRLFWDAQGFGYFSTVDSDPSLIQRKRDFSDNATPSPNGIAVQNLLKLSLLTGKNEYQEKAEQTLRAMATEMTRYPSAYASSLQALDFHHDSPKQVFIVGERSSTAESELLSWLAAEFIPNKVVMRSSGSSENNLPPLRDKAMVGGSTTFYICSGSTCYAPTTNIDHAKELIMGQAKAFSG